jgi:hypothetical protein
VSHLSARNGAQGRVARYHEIVVVISMLDSSLIVAALGASGRTRRSRGDGQARPWAAPTRRNRRGPSASQDADTAAPNLDNASAEQVLTETTPRK